MQKIEELTSEATVFQLLRNSGQWGVCPENTKEKFSSSSLRQNGGRWRREIIMPWKGLKNLGIGTWLVIHSDNPTLVVHTECHSRPECSYPERRRDEWNVIRSWRDGGVGLRRRVRSPLWRSVSVSVGNRGFGQVKREGERERERDEDEGRHGYRGALRVLALYFWFFSASWNCFFFFFASAQTQVCSHSSLFLLNFLRVFVFVFVFFLFHL